MTRYYVDGKEITKEQANEIDKKNNEIMKSNDIAEWSKIQWVTKIQK